MLRQRLQHWVAGLVFAAIIGGLIAFRAPTNLTTKSRWNKRDVKVSKVLPGGQLKLHSLDGTNEQIVSLAGVQISTDSSDEVEKWLQENCLGMTAVTGVDDSNTSKRHDTPRVYLYTQSGELVNESIIE